METSNSETEWMAPYYQMNPAGIAVMQSMDSFDIIDHYISRLDFMLKDENQRKPDYNEFKPDGENEEQFCASDREFLVSMMMMSGKFCDLDHKALITAVNIFDRFQADHSISIHPHFCPSQCLVSQPRVGKKRKQSICKMCSIHKLMVTHNVMISSLLLAGEEHFTPESGFASESNAIKHLMELFNPKLDLAMNFDALTLSSQAKFKELREWKFLSRLKNQIKNYFNSSLLEPTPAYHFFELFCGILSQHLTSKTVEAALNRLVEVHKWQKCLKQKHQLIAWACIIEQLNDLEERYLSQELSQMIKVIQTNLNISDANVDSMIKMFSACRQGLSAKMMNRISRLPKAEYKALLSRKVRLMNFTFQIKKTKLNFKKNFRNTERESTYGTISYAGHRPKEQMILHPFDEVEEDNFNQSRSSSPTDSILSDNSETSV